MNDWLDTAAEKLEAARDARANPPAEPPPPRTAGALVLHAMLPSVRRHNERLELELHNLIDAAVIAAAQAEADFTGQREFFQLVDGTVGSVDAAGVVYDEQPPQG